MAKHNRIIWLAALAAVIVFAGCNDKKAQALKSQRGTGTSAEPDKVLFERAENDIKRSHFEEARLALQTLINTYPDSEYLAKAKLALGDSYFKQGGPTGYTQAIAEYQDFVTFFPFLDEAAYAQLQVGMAHYRQMEKPDRDREEAVEAEGALQTFLQKYPNSQLYGQAEQRLREVQEVLADGDFRVAAFYFLRRQDKASAARLYELVNRYPLYSQADRANWMLASIAEHSEHNEIAGQYYARIVKDYPLSQFAGESKAKLEKFGMPVPQPDPASLARMEKEQQTPRSRGSIFKAPAGMLKSSPDVSMAARTGTPTLTPENTEAGDILTPTGINFAAASASGASGSTAPGGTGSSAFVETVTPGSPGSISAVPGAAAAAPSAATSTGGDASQPAATSTDTSSSGASADSPAANSTPATNGKESSSKKKKGLKKIIP